MKRKDRLRFLIIKGLTLIVASVCLAILMNLNILGISIARVVMSFAVLLCGYRFGSGYGAIAGSVYGIILTIQMGNMAPLGIYCVMGTLAGSFRSIGRIGSSLSYAAALVGLGVWYADMPWSSVIPETGIAVAVFLLLPSVVTDYAETKISKSGLDSEKKKKENLLAGRVGDISESLAQVARSFSSYQIPDDLETGLAGEEMAATVAWKNRFLESRNIVALQFAEMGSILSEVREDWEGLKDISKSMEHTVGRILHLRHLRGERYFAFEHANGCREVQMVLYSENGKCTTTKELVETLSHETKKRWRAAEDSMMVIGRDRCFIHLIEDSVFQLIAGVAHATKWGEDESGDHFSIRTLPDGKRMLGLSDGMGSGRMASMESEWVLDLAEQLLESGFSLKRAVHLINSVMLVKPGEQRPTTLDIAQVDLYSGNCRIVKLGAAQSFIKRGHQVEAIGKMALPIGVLEEVSCEEELLQLQDEDFIIMVTDGVLDALPGADKEAEMKRLVEKITNYNPKDFAGQILYETLGDMTLAEDDMTVLVAGIWKK